MNLIKEPTLNIFNDEIIQIKLAVSSNDKFFVCVLKSNTFPICFINYYNNQLNEFKEIDCNYTGRLNIYYKVFYFKETNEFMHIPRYGLTAII